jgi:Zn-finger nucleic acid-binding protein
MDDLPPHRPERGEPMRCPACSARLVELERSDVLIDACPSCRGVWLDRGELDRILERERRVAAGVVDDDEDFLREMSGRGRSSGGREREPRYDERDRDSAHYKKKKRKSMLEELFDF